MQGILAAKCIQANATQAVFVMNMFNVNVAVSQDTASSSSKQVSSGDEPMGYDMYFWQNTNGLIPQVAYDEQDSPFYVNVKLAAINAFQTSVAGAMNATHNVAQLDDPTGVHAAQFSISQVDANTVGVASVFNANSYISFMDPTLTSRSVLLNATARLAMRQVDGAVLFAENRQHVLMIQNQNQNQKSDDVTLDTDETGYGLFMSSVGTLQLNATSTSGSMLASRNASTLNKATATLKVFSMVDAARNLHSAASLLKSREVAHETAELLRQGLSYRVVPYVHTRPVQKALRSLQQTVLHASYPAESRLAYLRLCARANLHDVLLVFLGQSYHEETKSALFYTKHASPAICNAIRSDKQLSSHLNCPGAKLVVAGRPIVNAVSLPFNRTGSASATLGGSAIGVTFAASFLVGTNLNCNNPAFAYEATADASATLHLFGESQQALDANFVYGQNGAAPLADDATVSAFGKPVWSQAIPGLQYCKAQSYPIGNVQKGIDLQHTVWVSIVPVTFTASADLGLSLSWQWSICSNDLSASIGITPGSTLTFAGGAEVDLLVLRAGVSLSASFEADVVPEAFVHGTQCQAGVEVELDKKSVTGVFQGYYAWRHCKYWIFDCKWGEHHQTDFWQHNGTPSTSTLLNKTFTISI